jgi:hypothetical protein
MKSRYEVHLNKEEREILTGIVKQGKGPAYRIKDAYILLHADKKESEETDTENSRNISLPAASLPAKAVRSR